MLREHPVGVLAGSFGVMGFDIAVLGFCFSALMDVWLWLAFWPHTWPAFLVVHARGIPYDTAHAIGNLVLALAVGPELRRLLARYGRRLRTEIAWV